MKKQLSYSVANELIDDLFRLVQNDRTYRIMEFCGSHTYSIYRSGLRHLLPPNIELVHGPGCPVCVLPASRIDTSVSIASREDVIFCSFGDVLRVPGSKGRSLMAAQAEGADVRIVYSPYDCLSVAHKNPDKTVVFLAAGFETTTPSTACVVLQSQTEKLSNFTVFSNHFVTPPAIQNILESPDLRKWGAPPLDGFIGPGHVSTVIGLKPFEFFSEEYRKPVVIAGFDPVDILTALRMLVLQINEGRSSVENQYNRIVSKDGNRAAQAAVAQVFELRKNFEWRGLGIIPYSGLRLKKDYSLWDAEERFSVLSVPVPDHPSCLCGAILRGLNKPEDCLLFAKACTPTFPIGPCMVSSEGACAAYYAYGREGVDR